MKKHSDDKLYECEKCSKHYRNVRDQNRHQKDCGLPKNHYQCMYEDCSYSNSSIRNFNEHLKVTHGTDSNYTCLHCDMTFKNRNKVHKHALEMHPELFVDEAVSDSY